MGDMVDDTGDPARFVLDGVYARIAAEIGISEADVFDGARILSSLDGEVSAALATGGGDLPAGMEMLRTTLSGDLSPLIIEGVIDGDFWGSTDQVAVHRIVRIGGPHLLLDASMVLTALPASADVAISYEHDVASLADHLLPAGLGEVMLAVLVQGTIPSLGVPPGTSGMGPVLAWLEASLDCSVVGHVLSTAATVSTLTDEAWYTAACTQVLSDVADRISDTADALDAAHPALGMAGTCDFLDGTGYARPDHSCAGQVEGVTWGGLELAGSSSIVLERPPVVPD